ncbi:F-actin capping protein, putative [Bodo saltans]|uniref:F-actin-capping protein subunit alpha n=1 Tax=Bodo saltans TaxID=75058 RepID=A0A0S4JGK1_BODSA|nr:F-actin capping protein, putative [Bodo saltans]|eukprot:CUG89243.1 F-actin capping protein, putative [Bodo saltans]
MALHDVESIRGFVLQAPPGQLQEVLKSLHSLCGGSPTFFESIHDACLEYTMRHLCAFVLSGDAQQDRGTVVMCSKHNQLIARIKRRCKHLGVEGETILAEFLEYFSTFSGPSPTEGDDLAPFANIDSVFFDFNARVYFEVDPVEGRVVRCKPFATGQAASGEVAALQSPDNALHQLIASGVDNYVRSAFGAEVWWQHGRQKMFGGQNATEDRSQKKLRSSRNVAGSHVSVDADSFLVAISCERYTPSSRWAARWKSLYQVTVMGGVATVRGEGRVDGHYFEDSNIHVSVEDVMPETTVTVASSAETADAIVETIRNAETDLQKKLEHNSKAISETALRGLRRRLPVTKQPFDFQKAMLQLPSVEERF